MNYLLKKMMGRAGLMDEAGGDNGKDNGGGAPAGGQGDGGQQTPPDDKSKAGGEGGQGGQGDPKKPTDEEARLLKEVMQKKDALKKSEDALAKATERLKEFDGIDPAAVKKLLNDQKAAEDKQLEAKGEWDRLKGRMAEEHSKQMGALQDQIKALQGELGKSNGTINELSIGTQFGQSQYIAGELTLPPAKARALYGDHFDLVDGKVVGYDKPRGSTGRTAIVDGYGNAVGFDDAMRKIVEADPEKDYLVKSKVKAGAGSESSRQSQSKKGGDAPKSSVDRIAAGLGSLKII